MQAHHGLSVRSNILKLLRRCLVLILLLKICDKLFLLGLCFLALLNRPKDRRWLATFGVKVPNLYLRQECSDNNVVCFLTLPGMQPFEAQGIRAEDDLVMHV